MKKGVAILISAVCLVAVVLVAIFGTRPQGIVPVVYISSLTIKPSDNSAYKANSSGEHQCIIYYDAGLEESDGTSYYMSYVFVTDVLPDSVTNRSYVYTIASEYSDFITFATGENSAHTGAFLIKKHTDRKTYIASISVRPNDGGNGEGDTLKIILKYDRVYEDPASSQSA